MSQQTAEPSGWVRAAVLFAGVTMLLAGVFQALGGMAAALDPDLFVATPRHLYVIDVRWWGWGHVAAGLLIAMAGLGVLSGRVWARVAGIACASASLAAAFVFIPWAPVWSLLVVAADVAVVYALAVAGRRPVF